MFNYGESATIAKPLDFERNKTRAIHAAPLEAAQIRAAHRVVHEPVRADFHAADGFKPLGDGHGKLFLVKIAFAVWTFLAHLEKNPFTTTVSSSITLDYMAAALASCFDTFDGTTVIIPDVVFFNFTPDFHN
jgi:hypothetical protein